MNENDFEFLKSFPNIKIYYHPRLHAKYYGNERIALVITLNLNHTSPNNNIKYGIKIEGENHSLSTQIRTFLKEIIDESELVFGTSSFQQISPEVSNYAVRIAKIKIEYPNAYESWEKADDEKLELLFCEGKTIDELSKIFERQPSAIRSRVKKLELPEKYGL